MRRSDLYFPLKLPAFCTLLFGLVASVALLAWMYAKEEHVEQAELQRRAQFRVAVLQHGMNNAVDALQVVNRLFVTNGTVSQQQFRVFTQPLLARNPYIEAFAFSSVVTQAQRPAFEARMRSRYPGFTIGVMVDGKRATAAVKERYRVVEYIEPMGGHETALGLDASAQSFPADIVRRAEDTGLPSATGLYRLFQGTGTATGFRIFMPVYKDGAALGDATARRLAVVGYTLARISAHELVEKILATAGAFGTTNLDIHVYGAAAPDESKLVYGKAAGPNVAALRPVFGSRPQPYARNIDVAGTTWHVVISAQPAPFSAAHTDSLLVFLMGVLTTLAAAAYLQAVSARGQHIQLLVARRTDELRHANEALSNSEERTRKLAEHQELVKEEERKRIARDIHDDLGQNLMALRIDMSLMAAQAEAKPVTREQMGAAVQQVDTTIKAVRSIINDLRPAVLDLGLHAALEWQAQQFEQRNGIACDLQIDHEEFALDDQRATALFRIVQEALSNILRHARASQVQIGMQLRDGGLFLNIADNGVGLSADSRNKAKAFGLTGIEERIHALGGTCSMTNNPGPGMTLLVSIPVLMAATPAVSVG